MPRQSRIDITGALHHIIARGIERRQIFEDAQDRHDFLRKPVDGVYLMTQNDSKRTHANPARWVVFVHAPEGDQFRF